MNRERWRILLAVAVTVLLLALVVACGGPDGVLVSRGGELIASGAVRLLGQDNRPKAELAESGFVGSTVGRLRLWTADGYESGVVATSDGAQVYKNLRVGDGTESSAMDGEDAYIEGKLEVDGAARFDGGWTSYGTNVVSGAATPLQIKESDGEKNIFQFQASATGGAFSGSYDGSRNLWIHTGEYMDSWLDNQAGLGINTQFVTATLHAVQPRLAGAEPVGWFQQKDVSEEIFKLQGSAASGVLTQTLVAAGDVTTATVVGYVKVCIVDDGNQITDSCDLALPVYSLQ